MIKALFYLLALGLISAAVLRENREAIHAMLGFPYDLATNHGTPGKMIFLVLSSVAAGVAITLIWRRMPYSFKEGGMSR